MVQFLFDRIENMLGKGENAGFQTSFSLVVIMWHSANQYYRTEVVNARGEEFTTTLINLINGDSPFGRLNKTLEQYIYHRRDCLNRFGEHSMEKIFDKLVLTSYVFIWKILGPCTRPVVVIVWCFTPLSKLFQLYHGVSSNHGVSSYIHELSEFYQH